MIRVLFNFQLSNSYPFIFLCHFYLYSLSPPNPRGQKWRVPMYQNTAALGIKIIEIENQAMAVSETQQFLVLEDELSVCT